MTVRYLVRGLVQGVGYRNFVQRRATALGLVGWVRNLPDGRVEVVGQGSEAQLNMLAIELLAGPRHARVEGVEKVEIFDEVSVAKTFDIKS